MAVHVVAGYGATVTKGAAGEFIINFPSNLIAGYSAQINNGVGFVNVPAVLPINLVVQTLNASQVPTDMSFTLTIFGR